MMFEYGAPSRWIWYKQKEDKNCAEAELVCFRRSVFIDKETLAQKASDCMVRVSAETRYKLYINGVFVEEGPEKSDGHAWYFDTINIGSYLEEGENVIAAEVLHYPPISGKGSHSLFRTNFPGFYFEEVLSEVEEPYMQTWSFMKEDYKDLTAGGRLGITADENWKVCRNGNFRIVPEPGGFKPLYINEEVKGNFDICGYRMPGYNMNKKGWEDAVIYNSVEIDRAKIPGDLRKRQIPFMERKKGSFNSVKKIRQSVYDTKSWQAFLREVKELCIPAGTTEKIEISAGEEICAFLSLSMRGGKNSCIKILCSESYATDVKVTPDGQQHPVKGDREDCENGFLTGFTDVYYPGGFGEDSCPEVYEPFFFRTFRFVQLEINTKDEPLYLLNLSYEETGYPLEVKSWATTSDDTLKDIWDISLRTLKRCMHETYMDCPFYEQLQYAMDARSQMLYTYSISYDDRLARKALESFRKSVREDGLINCCYPNFEVNVIPGFSIFYILMLHDHMMYFGDKELLKKHFTAVDGILSFYDSKILDNGLVGAVGGKLGESRYWDFIDWTSEWKENAGVPGSAATGQNTMDSLLYLYGLQAAAEIFLYAGRKALSEEYSVRAKNLMESIRVNCKSPEGFITDGGTTGDVSQHCIVFSILTGVYDPKEGKKFLKRTIEKKDKYAQCSVAMAYYLFRALEMCGMYEYTDKLWDIWRGMLKNNLTTCVEDGVSGRSDCHAWGALALYELPASVLGVRPAAPGYEKIRIEPHPGKLTHAEGEVITKKGIVHVSWKKNKDGKLEISFNAPDDTEIAEPDFNKKKTTK